MGGYAAFIWPSYGIAALVLIGLLIDSWAGARRREAEVLRLRALGADVRRRTPGGTGEPR